ncbi:4-(cytidine 5'-diphospho)-2-C-methyl-D-erythritol kinase [Leucobacter allii]|uniref:4-diphosphocytidyl-2-C-methyl-D-erythritol kinase n=1 Tax=Leucobacter allii TaxID=2932247 RepID=A0ABY4FHX0_9MICO|nr:4-(cytidine 5'-diphospho)-2-C-methyl-D-erythritol kinase [Leucobacter allii]UOQ56098.1 4-(cytidine 5'-diphospho)-2-C-methyl-D-erythritol kinase [Leucobacter allii]UOR00568.1 4-(cytidine 5'-diphospho)-2-C-methyl-D-erythritol kinase [Leucobacter allii]
MGSIRGRSITVRAPGKINVFFRVGALQQDGYHDVASLYQAVSLFEEVTAAPAADFSVRFTGPIDGSALPVDDRNLALAAAKLLAERTGYPGGAALTVFKRVPIAGGMGGGSADAAATLLACDELWGTGLGRHGLLPLAAELGADVPFALEGGTAVGTGRGDELSPALAKGSFHWVLVLSDAGLSTPRVYGTLDAHRERHAGALGPQPELVKVETAVLQAVRVGDADSLAEAMHNDLQVAALKLAPGLVDLLEQGESRGALAGIVSGSGPTLAFLVDSAEAAASLRGMFCREGHRAITVTGPVPGARVLEG